MTSQTHPSVSVITPVLNRVDAIERCLASVRAQGYPAIEHIVVDGGSTDGTQDVIERFASDGGIRWISERDDGMYEAINKGLALANGEVLAYLNSDDLYFPWSVDVAVSALGQGADLVFGDLAVIARRSSGRPYIYLAFYRTFDLNYYTHVATIGQPTVFWSRAVTDRIGPFDTQYKLLGDCEYWLRAATSGCRLDHVREVLAVQVDHDATLRVTQAPRLRDEFARLRHQYGELAGPARSATFERIIRGLRWRTRQLALRQEIKRHQPQKWPRFVGFLDQHDIPVNDARLLQSLLPEPLRPDIATWIDPDRFHERLLSAVGVDSR